MMVQKSGNVFKDIPPFSQKMKLRSSIPKIIVKKADDEGSIMSK